MIATDIASYLEDNSIGTVGTDIFIDALPDTQDDMIAVYNTGGFDADIDIPVSNPTCEILVRSMSAATAQSTAESIKGLLHQKMNSTLVTGGYYFYYVFIMGDINLIGRDEKQRVEYSINFRTKIRG